jgi:hypothetical protein
VNDRWRSPHPCIRINYKSDKYDIPPIELFVLEIIDGYISAKTRCGYPDIELAHPQSLDKVDQLIGQFVQSINEHYDEIDQVASKRNQQLLEFRAARVALEDAKYAAAKAQINLRTARLGTDRAAIKRVANVASAATAAMRHAKRAFVQNRLNQRKVAAEANDMRRLLHETVAVR